MIAHLAGQYTDTESGYQYLRARYYDPGTAQFLSRDPLEPITGTPYAYGGNNPVNFTDPSGLFRIPGTNICIDIADPSCQSIVEQHPEGFQEVANAAGGVLNGITLGHAQGVLNAGPLDAGDNVNWDSQWARRGNWVGTALDVPLAIGAPNAFGYALVGSATINGYQCYQQGLPASFVIPGVISLAAGLYGGLFGSRLGSLGGLLFGNLFDFNFDRGRFSVELAAGYC